MQYEDVPGWLCARASEEGVGELGRLVIEVIEECQRGYIPVWWGGIWGGDREERLSQALSLARQILSEPRPAEGRKDCHLAEWFLNFDSNITNGLIRWEIIGRVRMVEPHRQEQERGT